MGPSCIKKKAFIDYSTKTQFPNISQALSTYGSDSQMTSLLDEMDVYVLPVFNIDGYDFTHKSVCYNLKLNLWSNLKEIVLNLIC